MQRRLLITVHGIRTFGQWQERLGALVESDSQGAVTVHHYKYGYFSVLAFLVPILRWLVRRRFVTYLRGVVASGAWDQVDIVCHSFGTHIVGWALWDLRNDRSSRIGTVILCGSVLRSTFPWSQLLGTRIERLINDCGTRDNVLVLSQALVLLTGMAGRIGFNGALSRNFQNRYFRFGHSGYFENKGAPTDQFMQRYWLPLLSGSSDPEAVDERATTSYSGLAVWLLNHAEPIKLTIYIGPLILAILWINGLYRGATAAAVAAQISESRSLVEQAKQRLSVADFETARELLVNALPTSPSDSRPYNPEAESLLYQSIYSSKPISVPLVGADDIALWSFSESGNHLWGASSSGDVFRWRASTGEREHARRNSRPTLEHAQLVAGGNRLVGIASDTLYVDDTTSGKHIRAVGMSITSSVRNLAVSPKGAYGAVIYGGDEHVTLYNLVDGSPMPEITSDIEPESAIFAPDESALAIVGNAAVEVWEVPSLTRRAKFPLSVRGVEINASFDVSGRRLAISSFDSVEVFDSTSGQRVTSRKTFAGAVMSSDGKQLALKPADSNGLPPDTGFVLLNLDTNVESRVRCICKVEGFVDDFVITDERETNSIGLRSIQTGDLQITLQGGRSPDQILVDPSKTRALVTTGGIPRVVRLNRDSPAAATFSTNYNEYPYQDSTAVSLGTSVLTIKGFNFEQRSDLIKSWKISRAPTWKLIDEVAKPSDAGKFSIRWTRDDQAMVLFYEGNMLEIRGIEDSTVRASVKTGGVSKLSPDGRSVQFVSEDLKGATALSVTDGRVIGSVRSDQIISDAVSAQRRGGMYLALADGGVRFDYYGSTRKPDPVVDKANIINALAISANERYLAVLTSKGRLTLHDTSANYRTVNEWTVPARGFKSISDQITSTDPPFTFETVDSGIEVSANSGTKFLIPLPNGTDGAVFEGRSNFLAVSPGGRNVQIWKVSEGGLIVSSQLDSDITALAVSTSGHCAAVGTAAGEVLTLSIPKGTVQHFSSQRAEISKVAVDAECRLIAVDAGASGALNVLGPDGKVVRQFIDTFIVFDRLVFSDDGNFLYGTGTEVEGDEVFDFAWEAPLRNTLPPTLHRSDRTPLGSFNVGDDGGIDLTLADGSRLSATSASKGSLEITGGPDLTFSPDRNVYFQSADNRVGVYDAKTNAELIALRSIPRVAFVRFSPDSKYILLATEDEVVRLWRISSKAEVAILRGHAGPILDAFFLPHVSEIVTISGDKTVRVWPYFGSHFELLESLKPARR